MKVIDTKFKGLKIIQQIKHGDGRGNLRETFVKKIIKWDKLIFDYATTSKKNVLRGFHFQSKFIQAKFVSVLRGKILDCVIDLRKKSKTFGKYFSIVISDKSDFSFYIPKGFAHGFLCLSKKCTVNYKCSNYRSKNYEKTLSWKDQTVNIKWPIKNPILSLKDKKGDYLKFFLN